MDLQERLDTTQKSMMAVEERAVAVEVALIDNEKRRKESVHALSKAETRLLSSCEQVAMLSKKRNADARRIHVARALAACFGFAAGVWTARSVSE